MSLGNYVTCVWRTGERVLQVLHPQELQELTPLEHWTATEADRAKNLLLLVPINGGYRLEGSKLVAVGELSPGFWVVAEKAGKVEADFGLRYDAAEQRMVQHSSPDYDPRNLSQPSFTLEQFMLHERRPLQMFSFDRLRLVGTGVAGFLFTFVIGAIPGDIHVPLVVQRPEGTVGTVPILDTETLFHLLLSMSTKTEYGLHPERPVWLLDVGGAQPGATVRLPSRGLAIRGARLIGGIVELGRQVRSEPTPDLLAGGPLEGEKEIGRYLHRVSEAEFAQQFPCSKELGRGEYGVVHLCRQARTGKTVVVKEALGSSDSLVFEAAAGVYAATGLRLYPELQASARFPALLGLYATRKTCYLVLDYVEGVTLRKAASESETISLEREGFVQVLSDVWGTLLTLELLGVEHNDTNAGNIMLSWDSQNLARATVLDFGMGCVFNPGWDRHQTTDDGYSWRRALASSLKDSKSADTLLNECPGTLVYTGNFVPAVTRGILRACIELLQRSPSRDPCHVQFVRNCQAVVRSPVLNTARPNLDYLLTAILANHARCGLDHIKVTTAEEGRNVQLLPSDLAENGLFSLHGTMLIPTSYTTSWRMLQYALWYDVAYAKAPELMGRWFCHPRILQLIMGPENNLVDLVVWIKGGQGHPLESIVGGQHQLPPAERAAGAALLGDGLRQLASDMRRLLGVELGNFGPEVLLWDEAGAGPHARFLFLPSFFVVIQSPELPPGLTYDFSGASQAITQKSIAAAQEFILHPPSHPERQ